MNPEALFNTCMGFYYAHKLITVIGIVVVAVLAYIKPKEVLKLIAIFAVAVVVIYLLSLMGDMTSTGKSQKEKMVDRIPD